MKINFIMYLFRIVVVSYISNLNFLIVWMIIQHTITTFNVDSQSLPFVYLLHWLQDISSCKLAFKNLENIATKLVAILTIAKYYSHYQTPSTTDCGLHSKNSHYWYSKFQSLYMAGKHDIEWHNQILKWILKFSAIIVHVI